MLKAVQICAYGTNFDYPFKYLAVGGLNTRLEEACTRLEESQTILINPPPPQEKFCCYNNTHA